MANPTGWKPSMEKGAGRGADAQDDRGSWAPPAAWPGGAAGLRAGLAGAACGVSLPPVPAGADPAAEIPAALLRGEIAGMPEMAELEVVRHFTRLSQSGTTASTPASTRSAPAP